MWIEEMDRIFRCSDIFKVSHKRQTRELEENHYSPLENMLPYHAATVVWKMKKKHMQRGNGCFYACQVKLQFKFLFSSSCEHKLYVLNSGMLPLLENQIYQNLFQIIT